MLPAGLLHEPADRQAGLALHQDHQDHQQCDSHVDDQQEVDRNTKPVDRGQNHGRRTMVSTYPLVKARLSWSASIHCWHSSPVPSMIA